VAEQRPSSEIVFGASVMIATRYRSAGRVEAVLQA
jgi:hypothetical protein